MTLMLVSLFWIGVLNVLVEIYFFMYKMVRFIRQITDWDEWIVYFKITEGVSVLFSSSNLL